MIITSAATMARRPSPQRRSYSSQEAQEAPEAVKETAQSRLADNYSYGINNYRNQLLGALTYKTVGLVCDIRNPSENFSKKIPISIYEMDEKFEIYDEALEKVRVESCKKISCDNSAQFALELRDKIFSDIRRICKLENAISGIIYADSNKIKGAPYTMTEVFRTTRKYVVSKGNVFSKPKQIELEYIFSGYPIRWTRADTSSPWKPIEMPDASMKMYVHLDRRPLPGGEFFDKTIR